MLEVFKGMISGAGLGVGMALGYVYCETKYKKTSIVALVAFIAIEIIIRYK